MEATSEDELANSGGLLRNDSTASGAKEEDACLASSLPMPRPPPQPAVYPENHQRFSADPLPTAGQPTSLGPQNDQESASLLEQVSAVQSSSAPEGVLGEEATREEDRDLDWVVWSSDDVGDWIDLLLGEGIGEPFRRNTVDGPTLLELTEDDLRVSLEMGNALHRQKILGHVRVFQMRRARLAQHAARRRLAESQRQAYADQENGDSPDGSPLHYAPPSRKKQGQSQGYSTNSNGEASVDSRAMVDSPQLDSGFSTSTRFAQFTNPSRSSTTGLTSCFGLDSPSYSLRGSWNTAPRKAGDLKGGPGPCSYNVISNLESPAIKGKTACATIGNSPRHTSENFVNPNTTLGGGGQLLKSTSRPKVKGGVIGTSTRWNHANGRTPGPASYRPRANFLSTFK